MSEKPKTENKKTIKVFVKEDTYVKINGKKHKIKKGQQTLDSGMANILITAGYAEKI